MGAAPRMPGGFKPVKLWEGKRTLTNAFTITDNRLRGYKYLLVGVVPWETDWSGIDTDQPTYIILKNGVNTCINVILNSMMYRNVSFGDGSISFSDMYSVVTYGGSASRVDGRGCIPVELYGLG